MSIGLGVSPPVDTPVEVDYSTFEDIALGAAVDRWQAGKVEVLKSLAGVVAGLAPVQGQHVIEFSQPVQTLDQKVHGGAGLRGADWWATREGKSFRLEVSPGTVGLASIDTNKAEKAVARAIDAHFGDVDQAASFISDAVFIGPGIGDKAMAANAKAHGRATVDYETGEIYDGPQDAKRRSEVREWSKRSRMRMVRAVAQLDYSDWTASTGMLAMVTLTYPALWERVAPNGKAMKKHFERLRMRWTKAIGRWRVLWKLEFQHRGAPHIHFLTRVPAMVKGKRFESWLSSVWAEIVGASTFIDGFDQYGRETSEYIRHHNAGTRVDFSGSKFSDPRRIALYFLGHSIKGPDGKEYQHIVPEAWQTPGNGPGRFWGFSGFDRAVVELEITLEDFYRFAREFRKLSRARDWKAQLVRHRGIMQRRDQVPWTDKASNALPASKIGVYKKRTRAMGGGGSVLGGWVLLNDALPVVEKLGVLLQGSPTRQPGTWCAASFESGFRVPVRTA